MAIAALNKPKTYDKHYQDVTVSDAMLVNSIQDFHACRFSAKGQDLMIILPDQQTLLQGYYRHTPILIDQIGNRYYPEHVAKQITDSLHVTWGERARVLSNQLPSNFDLNNQDITLKRQGYSGFLTANDQVLRPGDCFKTSDNLIYYHNETGKAWDEVCIEQQEDVGVIKVVVDELY